MHEPLFTGTIHTSSPPQLPSTHKCTLTLDTQTQTLTILLISTSNILTFHICTISPADFSITRRKQGIKVDFERFTRTLVNFLVNVSVGDMQAVLGYEKRGDEKGGFDKDRGRYGDVKFSERVRDSKVPGEGKFSDVNRNYGEGKYCDNERMYPEKERGYGDLRFVDNVDKHDREGYDEYKDKQNGTKNEYGYHHKGRPNEEKKERNVGNLLLTFVENNSFRNIVKLELIFYKPDEAEFRKYLSEMMARFENENIRLARDNKKIRDEKIMREKEWKDRIENMDSENESIRRDNERLYREKCVTADENKKLTGEIEKMNRRLEEMERKIKESDIKREDEIAEERERHERRGQERENEIEERHREKTEILEREIKRIKEKEENINETITRLEEKNEKLRDKIAALERKLKETGVLNKDLKSENERLAKRINLIDIKLQESQKGFQEKTERIESLEKERKTLAKKLENAQSVYDHFYNRKIENKMEPEEESSLFSSIQPESPPH